MMKRPKTKPRKVVPCKWEVMSGGHFPKSFGLFDSEEDAERCVAEQHAGARFSMVVEWAEVEPTDQERAL